MHQYIIAWKMKYVCWNNYYVCFHGDIKAIQKHLQILTDNSGLSQIQSRSICGQLDMNIYFLSDFRHFVVLMFM